MSSSIKQTGNQLTITITATESDLTPTVKSVYNRLRGDVNVNGFRPGKAPNHIIDRELGTERVQAEVIDAAAEKLYRQAIKEHELRPISHPHVTVKKFVAYNELELEVSVEIMPEVTLPDYRKVTKSLSETTVSDKEVEEVLDSLRERLATREPVQRAASKGDEATIDFRGTRNDKDIPGAKSQDYTLILGSGKFVPGFEEEIIGVKAGDEKDFSVTFPKDYNEPSLAGQQVDFHVKVKQVASVTKPEMDDDFAKSAGPFESLDKLKEDVRNHLQSEKEQAARRQLENEVIREVVEGAKMDVPESMLAQEKERVREDVENRLSQQQLDLDAYLEQVAQTHEEFEAELSQRAVERVKTALVITEVAKAEDLRVSPEELEVRLQLLAGQYQDQKVQEEIQKPEVKQEISDQMLAEKTVQFLIDQATSTENAKKKPKTSSAKQSKAKPASPKKPKDKK